LVSRVVLDEIVVAGGAANQEVAEHSHAGRGAADDSATTEYPPEGTLGLGATVGCDIEVLAAAIEPNAPGLSDDRDERVAISDFAALREEHTDIACAVLAEPLADPTRRCTHALRNAVVGHIEDERIRPARCIYECLVYLRPLRATPHRNDGPVGRADLDRSGPEGLGLEGRIKGAGATGPAAGCAAMAAADVRA